MNDKQKQFIREYLVDLNGKQAAIRAGYSPKTAEVQASRLLSNAKVALEVDKKLKKRNERTEITSDRVVAELAKIAFSNAKDYYRIEESGNISIDLSKVTKEQAAAISEVIVENGKAKLRLLSKVDALDKLMRHTGAYKDKVEISCNLNERLERAFNRLESRTNQTEE